MCPIRKPSQGGIVLLVLPEDGLLGAENRSSSGDAPNKSELGLALEAIAIDFVVFGLEEKSSSSACSLPNKSACFTVVAGLSGCGKKKTQKTNQ